MLLNTNKSKLLGTNIFHLTDGRSAKGGHDKMFADDLARKIAMMNEGMDLFGLVAKSLSFIPLKGHPNDWVKALNLSLGEKA